MQCGRPGLNPWVGKIPWRRKWQSTPVLLPGESHGWRSLVSYSPRGCKESDTTEQLHLTSPHLNATRANAGVWEGGSGGLAQEAGVPGALALAPGEEKEENLGSTRLTVASPASHPMIEPGPASSAGQRLVSPGSPGTWVLEGNLGQGVCRTELWPQTA